MLRGLYFVGATAGREIARLLKNHGITEYNVAKINHLGEKLSDSDNPGVDFVLKALQEIASQDITQKKEIMEFKISKNFLYLKMSVHVVHLVELFRNLNLFFLNRGFFPNT